MTKFLLIFCFCLTVSAKAQQPFWNQANGPSGGSSEFAFTSHGDIFNLSADLKRSTDDGASWQNRTPNFLHGFPDGFAILDDYIFILTGGNLFRSTDNGLTFDTILKNAGGGSLYTSRRGVLFIYSQAYNLSGHSTFKRSTDDGKTWTDISSKFPSASQSFFFFSITATGELTLQEYEVPHFYYSFDNGSSWTEQSTIPIRLHTKIVGTTNGDLFCGQASPDSVTDVLHNYAARSTDNGKTWSYTTAASTFIVTSNDYVCALRYADRIEYTSDHGISWQSAPMPDGNYLSSTQAYPDLQGQIYWSLGDRASRYNTVTTKVEEISVPISNVTNILVDPDDFIIARGSGFFSESANKGQTWLSATGMSNAPFPGNFGSVIKDSGQGLIASLYNALFRSTDRGVTWVQANTNPIGFPYTVQLLAAPNGSIFACGSDSNILRSTDLGKTWKQSSIGLSNTFSTSITSDQGGDLFTFSDQNIYRSTNNGDSWQRMVTITAPFLSKGIVTTSDVSCMTATTKGEIFAGTTHDGIILSSDGGVTWQVIDEVLGSAKISGLFAAPNGDVFGISKGGSLNAGIIFRPYHGSQWFNANDGLGDASDAQTLAFASDGTAYLGTHGRGVWRSQGVVNAVEKQGENPNDLSLNISPNPASSQITVSYSLPEPAITKLELCDELGRTLQTIENGIQTGGVHNQIVHFNGLVGGIYLVRVSTPAKNITAKIVVSK